MTKIDSKRYEHMHDLPQEDEVPVSSWREIPGTKTFLKFSRRLPNIICTKPYTDSEIPLVHAAYRTMDEQYFINYSQEKHRLTIERVDYKHDGDQKLKISPEFITDVESDLLNPTKTTLPNGILVYENVCFKDIEMEQAPITQRSNPPPEAIPALPSAPEIVVKEKILQRPELSEKTRLSLNGILPKNTLNE